MAARRKTTKTEAPHTAKYKVKSPIRFKGRLYKPYEVIEMPIAVGNNLKEELAKIPEGEK
jgi:hypothetical protein